MSIKTTTSLQLANSALKEVERALKAEIRKLQSQKAKLEAKNVSLEAEVTAARVRIKECEKKHKADHGNPINPAEAARRIAFILNKGGFEFVGSKAVQVRKVD